MSFAPATNIAVAPKWERAYLVALGNAGLFLLLSATNEMLGITAIPVNVAVDIAFAAGSAVSLFYLVRAGGILAAVSYFVFGAGLFFGFGTAYSTAMSGPAFIHFFPPSEQERILTTINLVNSLSVFLVLLVAWPLSRRRSDGTFDANRVGKIVDYFQSLRFPMLAASSVVVLMMYATFPIPTELLLRNALRQLSIFVNVALLLTFARWSATDFLARIMAIGLFVALLIFAMLSLSKTSLVLTLVSVSAGLWFDRRSRWVLIGLLCVAATLYFGILADLCNSGRNNPKYSEYGNGISDREQILSETLDARLRGDRSTAQPPKGLLGRFASAHVQAFLIEEYNSGARGTTMAKPWQALVPRVLWKDKPVVLYGENLDAHVFRRANSGSALAPTYTAEAYWNGGWLGLIAVSAVLGLEVGWFTSKWNRFLNEGTRHIGVLFFAIPIMRNTGWVETWVVVNLVGGFATLVVLIKAADWAAPWTLAFRGRPVASHGRPTGARG